MEIVSHIGVLLARSLSCNNADVPWPEILSLVRQEEDILRDKYPGIPNDPLVTDTRTRGIRALRALIGKRCGNSDPK